VSFSDQRSQFLVLLNDVGSVRVAARELGVNENTAYGWARAAGKRSVRQARRDPRQDEFARLRAAGRSRREAASEVGIHERTARDWDRGIRKSRNSRFYPDGRRVDYSSGRTTMETMTSPPPLVPEQVGSRLLSLIEREKIADLNRAGLTGRPRQLEHARSRPSLSLRAIGRELGRAASTICPVRPATRLRHGRSTGTMVSGADPQPDPRGSSRR
jgi:transposase